MIARAAVLATLRPRREMWIGWSAVKAIVGQRLFPGFLDRYLAKRAWSGQETSHLPPGHPLRHERDNVDAPLPGDRGARGIFDSRARSFSTRLWVRRRRGWLALAGLAALLAAIPTARRALAR